MRKKLTPIPKLVKKLDDIFQKWVRYRDNFTCCTCGRKYPRGETTQLHAGTFSLSYRKSTQVKVDDNFYNKDYMRVKEEIDKAKIKTALLAGAEIAGACLVENKNLQVR